MRPGVDVSFQSVSKRYRIRQAGTATSTGTSPSSWIAKLRRGRERRSEFWAVKDVSFAVEHGESLGIIGQNGAGKSTILKMLSGITAPTAGQISIRGRLSALLEVGSGFHPELTGRENVYLSGSVLGMSRREIHRKLDAIVEFAGMQRFIDVPVKRYSSGMYVRLGFSIAAHIEPEVLLLDEVLAVGDHVFQVKCKERIGDLHRNGTTVIFISHDLTSVQALCQRVLLIEHGRIAAEGDPEEVIRKYTETTNLTRSPSAGQSSGAVKIVRVAFFDESGPRSAGFRTGFPIWGTVSFIAEEEIPNATLSVLFVHPHGWIASQWKTLHHERPLGIRPGRGAIQFSCNELGLQPGVYRVDVQIEDASTKRPLENQPGCTSIHVTSEKKLRGFFYSPHRWREIS
ncbi:MAG TPA: ABC transporter ATP-binding protein [Bryobacteraceae bacterium]|jgi:ABC-type polysaccharide/polyol phosphate transport system ATPase subunit|nr:ABC transporter ATP-binding protein [Bryobacteraceae bacterium]